MSTRKSGLGFAALSVGLLAVALGVAYALWGDHGAAANADDLTAAEQTGSVSKPEGTGKANSGLPLPRFVSLKTDRVNVRRGPSSDHDLSWVFTRKGLPVEIIAEYEHWRRVRDSEGAEGWVYHSLLTGRRTALVAPWNAGKSIPLRSLGSDTARPVAMVGAGVMGEVESCDGSWCHIAVDRYDGWMQQAMLWGVYPGERIRQ
ncbi:MAG: SH3 domain-containing protein [Parvibaculaceae bacterium]